jgi:hypothetical protein
MLAAPTPDGFACDGGPGCNQNQPAGKQRQRQWLFHIYFLIHFRDLRPELAKALV